jgi:hypothetical protein
MTLNEIIETIEDLVEALRDEVRDGDAERGKVVWPLPKDGVINYNDALATLFDIADCDLSFSFYGEDNNTFTDTLSVVFSGTELYPGSPGVYSRKPLKTMLEEELALYRAEDEEKSKTGRLFARLLKAFDEP